MLSLLIRFITLWIVWNVLHHIYVNGDIASIVEHPDKCDPRVLKICDANVTSVCPKHCAQDDEPTCQAAGVPANLTEGECVDSSAFSFCITTQH